MRSLKHRLMLVFALVALPPTLIGVIEAIETSQVHAERLRDSVRNYAALASTYHHALIENSTNILLDVARSQTVVPETGPPDATACGRTLAGAIRPFPVYASLVLFDARGKAVCGSDAAHLPEDAAQEEYFRMAVETKTAFLSGYVQPAETPVPILMLAQPVANSAADITGVLALGIRLDGLNESERFLSLPMEGVVYLLDRDGRTLHSVTVPADLGAGGLPERAGIWLQVNGVERQRSDIAQMIWNVPEVLAHLSAFVDLAPGDLVFTGTPEGVGPLQRGDRLRGGIDGLGELAVEIV